LGRTIRNKRRTGSVRAFGEGGEQIGHLDGRRCRLEALVTRLGPGPLHGLLDRVGREDAEHRRNPGVEGDTGDARRALVGGINIGPEYQGDGVTRGWFDLALQIEGPIAAGMAASFASMFALAPMNSDALRAFRRRRRTALALAEGRSAPADVRLLQSGPGWPAGRLSRALRADLAQAREVRCIAGYFLPPARIRRALRRCVRSGGVVQMLLAGRSDVPVARYAAEHLYSRMLAGGAQLFEYQPQILHAKLIILDDTVYVGSCNLDRRSLSINFELLLRLEWPELAAQARELFAAALAHSVAVPAAAWRSRRHWWERWRSRAAYWLLTRIDPLLARRRLRTLG